MLNTWSHIIITFSLALMILLVNISIRNDTNTRPLDTARYYTMVRERGDVAGARALLDSETGWLSSACRAAQNKTLLTDSCVAERKTLRDTILSKMNCFTYSSQVCSYLRNLTAGLIQTRTYGGTTYYVGKSLAGNVPGYTALTYRQLLQGAVDNAPYLFHNAYRAAQSDDFYVLRTVLYGLIIYTIFANLIVHAIDEYHMSWSYRLTTRILVFCLVTFVPTIAFLAGGMAASLTVLLGIWAPAVVILLYYEAFLDATITRPW
jgi:hypothetical protein